MITVGMNYHTLPGKQTEFEEKFAAVIEALNAAEGHSESTLWKDVSDDASRHRRHQLTAPRRRGH